MDKFSKVSNYCKERIQHFVKCFPQSNKIKLLKTFNYKLDFDNHYEKCIMLYAYTPDEGLNGLINELESFSNICNYNIQVEDQTVNPQNDLTCLFLLIEK